MHLSLCSNAKFLYIYTYIHMYIHIHMCTHTHTSMNKRSFTFFVSLYRKCTQTVLELMPCLMSQRAPIPPQVSDDTPSQVLASPAQCSVGLSWVEKKTLKSEPVYNLGPLNKRWVLLISPHMKQLLVMETCMHSKDEHATCCSSAYSSTVTLALFVFIIA